MKQIKIDKKLPEIELTNENIKVFTFDIPVALNITYTIGYICLPSYEDMFSGKKEKQVLITRRILMLDINNSNNQIKKRIDKEFIDKQ